MEKGTLATLSHGWKSPLKDTEVLSISVCLFAFFPPQFIITEKLQPEGDYDISVEIIVIRDETELEW